MANLLSLTWRFLLAAALVLNPVVGAATMLAGKAEASSMGTSAKAPPCHGMAHEMAQKGHASGAPDRKHGCGCGNPACEFGVCCSVGALDLPAPLFAPMSQSGAQVLAARGFREADSPPPARMIRPPIA